MKKVLFLIHDLGQGGAEKVLINLVNNMNSLLFDITVIALFGGGVNEQFLNESITYKTVFPRMIPGNSHIMKLLSPAILHSLCVKGKYDIEISYLEGPSARIISGSRNKMSKKVCWIHSNIHSMQEGAKAFRSTKECISCYKQFDKVVFVSGDLKTAFTDIFGNIANYDVLYNTNETAKIIELSQEACDEIINDEFFNIVAVGTLKSVKGFDRLLRVINRLVDERTKVRLYILGMGPLEKEFRNYIKENKLQNNVILLGHQQNPYKYVSKCDLYVCSSYSEGFSTAATEALIVGTPVCTTDVSGMKEMLGTNNEYGYIVDNDEKALYEGIKKFIDSYEFYDNYKKQAKLRGEFFSTDNTVNSVEEMLNKL